MRLQSPSDTVIINSICWQCNQNKMMPHYWNNFVSVGENAALVDTLVAKTRAWEEDHGMSFTYDGVPLLAMLDEYAMLRHEREEEKRRMRVSFTNKMIRIWDYSISA